MTTIPKTRISELTLITEADNTTVIPVSTGTPLSTKKISPNDLIKDTAALESKANLTGGNEFTGNQFIDGALTVGGALYTQADVRLDGDLILNKAEQLKFTDATELQVEQLYNLKHVTSDIQTQLDSKVASSTHTSDLALKANVANPTFTGTATMPTANVSTLSVSTAASVPAGTSASHAVNKSQLDAKAGLAGGNMFSGNQVFGEDMTVQGDLTVFGVVSLGPVSNDAILRLENVTSDVQAQLDAKAPIASPIFTGSPSATTHPPVGDSSTKLATTYFVNNAISLFNSIAIIVCTAELDVDFIDPTLEFNANKYAYNVNSQNLYISNGDGWVLVAKDSSKLYFFVTADTGAYRGKFYVWNGTDFIQ